METEEPTKINRSIGRLRKAQKTKPRSPDLVGVLQLQRHTIDVFAKQIDESAADEIPCCIASWINEDKNGQFLTIEISPKYVKREYRVTEGRNLSWLLGEPEDA